MKKKELLLLFAAGSAMLAALGIFVGRQTRQASLVAASLDSYSTQTASALHELLTAETVPETVSEISDMSVYEVPDMENAMFETESEAVEALTASAAYYREQDYPVPDDHRLIFVGDSRTVGAGRAESKKGDACIYIGESGEGYNWFSEIGIEQMRDAISQNPNIPVIFNLGVNDCDAIESYLALYRSILEEYPDTDFYFMSVNPVTEDSLHVPDTDVQTFNLALQAAFPEQYIDTYAWMTTYGFVSVDGVHYSEEQYCAIHDYAARAVLGLEQPEVGLQSEPGETEY